MASIVTDLDQLMFTDEASKDDCMHCCTHGYSPVSTPVLSALSGSATNALVSCHFLHLMALLCMNFLMAL
jgi:hypothetical protein